MQSLSSTSKPRGRKGGRRPTEAPAKDKRTAQIRRSQKIFRTKQKARLQELEAKEKELEAIKTENTILTIENSVLRSIVNFFRTRSFLSTPFDDLTRLNYKYELREENITGIFNTFDPLESARIGLKKRFFRKLFSVCGANVCHIPAILYTEQSFNDLNGEETNDQILNQEYLKSDQEPLVFSETNALKEFISIDGAQDPFSISSGVVNYIRSAQNVSSASLPDQSGRKSKLKNASDILNPSYLLNVSEIWDILEVISEFSVLNLERLCQNLSNCVFCSNLELVMTLDGFVKILSAHICDRKKL